MNPERYILALAACLMATASCSEGPDGGGGPTEPTSWETSTWRGEAILSLPDAPEAATYPSVLTVRAQDASVGALLVYDLGASQSVGQRVRVQDDGALALEDTVCSPGLTDRCDAIAGAIGTPRLTARELDGGRTLRADSGAIERITLDRDDWRRAPHDGFRPQTAGWPPCLEVNTYELLAKGLWDGRIITLPTLGWAKDPMLGIHCSWSHESDLEGALECSPSAFIDTYEDPERFELATRSVDEDLDAQTMSARFTSDEGTLTLDGTLDAFEVTNRGYPARQYRWSGRVLLDDELVGDFVFHSWGDASLWTPEQLEQCVDG